MFNLKAGFDRIRSIPERVSDKMMKQSLSSQVGNVGSQMMPKRPGLFHGQQYTIGGRTVVEERQINEGGFAFVWAARDVVTHEELALKKIVCQDNEKLAMAKREVELLERLPYHPNLVRYYGHTFHNPERLRTTEVILLFELCTGGHLLDLLDRNKGVLTETRILAVFKDICVAVALLHAMSPPVQHRDLKVENVLLGPNGSFKLCDFGSWSDERSDMGTIDRQARCVLQEQVERYTTMMYRPPEMVHFSEQCQISERVDIWMLGCILYTLMYYRHPFQDESTLAISNARYHMPPEPQFSEKLQDLTHWLLARDPGDRPSAPQVLGVLEAFTDGGALPLPKEVVERKKQQRRLYDSAPVCSKDHEHLRPATGEKKDRERKSGKPKSQRKNARYDSEPFKGVADNIPMDFWNQASLQQPAAADPWPLSGTVPQPSRAWATFDDAAQAWPEASSHAGGGGLPGGTCGGASQSSSLPSAPTPWTVDWDFKPRRRADSHQLEAAPGSAAPVGDSSFGTRASSSTARCGRSPTAAAGPPDLLHGRGGGSDRSERRSGVLTPRRSSGHCERSGARSPIARGDADGHGGRGAVAGDAKDAGGSFWNALSAPGASAGQGWDPFAPQWSPSRGSSSNWPAAAGSPASAATPAAQQGARRTDSAAVPGRSLTPPPNGAAAAAASRSPGREELAPGPVLEGGPCRSSRADSGEGPAECRRNPWSPPHAAGGHAAALAPFPGTGGSSSSREPPQLPAWPCAAGIAEGDLMFRSEPAPDGTCPWASTSTSGPAASLHEDDHGGHPPPAAGGPGAEAVLPAAECSPQGADGAARFTCPLAPDSAGADRSERRAKTVGSSWPLTAATQAQGFLRSPWGDAGGGEGAAAGRWQKLE